MVAENLVLELTLIIGVAAILSLICRLIKQPAIIAYLITGIIIGPLFFDFLKSPDLIKVFATLGVTFLLFLIGLSLDLKLVKEIRRTALTLGVGQVAFTTFIGFILAIFLGFNYTPAFFLAIAISFSSTIVVMKMLSDKREIETLHGRIIVATVVVQNIIAALVLLMLPVIGTSGISTMFYLFIKGIFLVLIVFLFTKLIVPSVLYIAAKSQEILLLFSVGWALAISALFHISGLSIEMGALVAGISLASSKFSLDISSKIKNLREFFVMIHLIFFGSLLIAPISSKLIISAILFSILVLVGNTLIVMIIMKSLGYKKKTSFLTGISIAQISEFSLIIAFLGFRTEILPRETLSLVVLIALITIGISSYAIHYSNKLYSLFSSKINYFDNVPKQKLSLGFRPQIILFGYNRIGFNLMKALKNLKKDFLVVDFNPNTIRELNEKGIKCIYGDAEDIEFLNTLPLNEAETIISTIPELETNLELKSQIKNKSTIFMATAHSIKDAEKLYSKGVDYVIMPHFLGGEFVANLLLKKDFNKTSLSNEKDKQLAELAERIIEGHEHPSKEEHGV